MTPSDVLDNLGGGVDLPPPPGQPGNQGGGIGPLRNYLIEAAGHFAEFGYDLQTAGTRLIGRNDELSNEALSLSRLILDGGTQDLAQHALQLPSPELPARYDECGLIGDHLDLKIQVGRRLARTMKQEMDSLARKLRNLGKWGDLLAKLLDSVVKAIEANPYLSAAFEGIKELLELAAVLAEEIGRRYAGRLGRA